MSPLLPRSVLLMATALSLSAVQSRAASAGEADRLGAIEKQIQALQSELKRVKADLAARNREARASHLEAPSAPVPAQASVMQTIPPGYALVPASPGSTPGSVVLARAVPPPEKRLPIGTFSVGAVNVTLGGFLESAAIYRSRNEVADITSNYTTRHSLSKQPTLPRARIAPDRPPQHRPDAGGCAARRGDRPAGAHPGGFPGRGAHIELQPEQ